MLNPRARFPEVQQASGRSLLPITLIGGFLGAGKTTLLNSLLLQADGRRLAVLVNDFGELNVDAKLIVKVEGQRMELASGCICCSIRDDLVAGVQSLIDTEPAPEHLVIETSGVSDPLNILCTFNTSAVRRRVYLENAVTVVDALHAFDASTPELETLFERQIRGAYMIVLNRVHAAGVDRVREVRSRILELLPGAAIIETDDGTAPLALLLGDARLGQSNFRPEPALDLRVPPFASEVFRTGRPLRRADFLRVMKQFNRSVYRAKGFVNFRSDRFTTLYQKVGSFESYVEGEAWGAATPNTELVLIGTLRVFDRDAICAALESCCAD